MALPSIKKNIIASLIILIISFLVYYLSNPQFLDHYKHQTYLALSLIKSHIDLIDYPIHYHDIFTFQGRSFTAFSLFPILFLVPWLIIFGSQLPQVFVAIIIGAINPVLVYAILLHFKLKQSTIILTILGYAFGTLNWYASVIATSWYFSHIIALFCLLLTINFLLNQRWYFAGLFFGLACLSRFPIIASLPALMIYLWLKKPTYKWHSIVVFITGLLPAILINFGYNYLRFSNIWETGYTYANLVYANVPSFGLQYLYRNLSIFLFKGFEYILQFPYLKPDPQGLNIFFTSPFLLLAFFCWSKKYQKIIISFGLAIFLIAGVVFSYFLTGWYQYGYRFLMDFLPFLIVLTALGMDKIQSRFIKIILITISIMSNLLGAYWGLTLGW